MKKTVSIEFDVDSDEYTINYGKDGIDGKEFGHMFNCIVNEAITENVMPIQSMLYLMGDLVGDMVEYQQELESQEKTPIEKLLN